MGQSGSGGTFGVTRLWACLWVSRLGPRCRSPGASPRCRRLRWIVSSSPLRPRRGRRHPDAQPTPPGRHIVVRVAAGRRSRCRRPFVAPRPCRRPLSRLPTGPLARRRAALAAASPCHRVVIVRAEADRRAFVRRRSSSSCAPRSPLGCPACEGECVTFGRDLMALYHVHPRTGIAKNIPIIKLAHVEDFGGGAPGCLLKRETGSGATRKI